MSDAKPRVLFVDDEQDNLDALRRLFRKDYECHFAVGGVEALKIISTLSPLHVIVSDQRMPVMTGVELFEKSLRIQPHAVRILVTGYTDIEAVIRAINEGHVYEYVSKPWEPENFKLTLSRAADYYKLQNDIREKNKSLSLALEQLSQLDNAKSRFLSLLSHELRTPLTTLQTSLDGLDQVQDDPDIRAKFFMRLRESSERLQRMVDEILLFSQATLKQVPSSLKTAHVTQKESLQALVSDIQKKHRQPKKVSFHLPENSTDLSPTQSTTVSIAITQLIDNAFRFASSEIHITIASDPTSLYCLVSDDGAGVSEEMKPALFKTFAAPNDLMHHSQGLGLGLKTATLFLDTLQGNVQLIEKKDDLPQAISAGYKLSGAHFLCSIPLNTSAAS